MSLTKKDVFMLALAGERVMLENDEWLDNKLLWSIGLISELDDKGMCYVLHNLSVVVPPNENRAEPMYHNMNVGTPLANMDRW